MPMGYEDGAGRLGGAAFRSARFPLSLAEAMKAPDLFDAPFSDKDRRVRRTAKMGLHRINW
jgi:hypothetical protein